MDTSTSTSAVGNPFRMRNEQWQPSKGKAHVHRHGVRCATDSLGQETPDGGSPFEIVVDATEGFIPLWEKKTILRWRFKDSSLSMFEDAEAAKKEIRGLMGEALLAWGSAAPVKFKENDDSWDFQVVVRAADDCDINGCVLASAFFPDAGRHDLTIYPKMFTQSRQEQLDTLIHEFGHAFGLRHFFAKISEKKWASEIFGEHKPFTIMNYGNDSVLTDADKKDLRALYRAVWKGELTEINGTPIRLVKPFHASGVDAAPVLAVGALAIR
jgi:hypothetical protein